MTLQAQPSQPAPSDVRVRPRALWYLAVAVLWVTSALVFGTAVSSLVTVVDHGVTAIDASGQVPVTDSGMTIYSRVKPVSHECVLRGASGSGIRMDGLPFDLKATVDYTTVHAVATSPDGLAPGVYRVTCPGVPGQLYYGDKLKLESLVVRLAISVVLGLVGLVLLIVLLVKRHTSRSRIRNERLLRAQTMSPRQPYEPYQPPPGYDAEPQPYQPPPGYDGSPPPPSQPPPRTDDDTKPG